MRKKEKTTNKDCSLCSSRVVSLNDAYSSGHPNANAKQMQNAVEPNVIAFFPRGGPLWDACPIYHNNTLSRLTAKAAKIHPSFNPQPRQAFKWSHTRQYGGHESQ
ncbi:hypothetical protein JTE90_002981 [Oedothorax gibbosus]|uniref:Uncharacterized protein n=1 Tax=Oedothorax gibbosus TaxID=931172 RepID=A0AAV6VHX3_9ARAC|nr:hypothetical protein JTE90_002981 [Oedothorax gibbosus]